MPKRRANGRSRIERAGIAFACDASRDDELLDDVVSSAAVVARADGWVQEVECSQLLNFIDRHSLFPLSRREEVLSQFESCVRELREPDGPLATFRRLGRYTEPSTATLILSVGSEVADADRRLDPREEQLLRLLRLRLGSEMP